MGMPHADLRGHDGEASVNTCVLHVMWMAQPGEASSMQGGLSVNCDILAGIAPGIGSGWQHSKQSWALVAVAGSYDSM